MVKTIERDDLRGFLQPKEGSLTLSRRSQVTNRADVGISRLASHLDPHGLPKAHTVLRVIHASLRDG